MRRAPDCPTPRSSSFESDVRRFRGFGCACACERRAGPGERGTGMGPMAGAWGLRIARHCRSRGRAVGPLSCWRRGRACRLRVWVPRLWHLAPGAITGVGDWIHRGWAGGWTSAAFQALHLGTVCVYLLRGPVCPGAGSGALALLLALLVSDA